MIELSRRSVAAKRRNVDGTVGAGGGKQATHLGPVWLLYGLLDAIRPDAPDAAAYVEIRLVDRIPERLSGVAEHDQIARLGHEGRQVADRSLDDDIDALHRDPAARRGVAVDHQQAAASGGAGRLGGVT